MFTANKLTRVRFGPEHGDHYDSRPAQTPGIVTDRPLRTAEVATFVRCQNSGR